MEPKVEAGMTQGEYWQARYEWFCRLGLMDELTTGLFSARYFMLDSVFARLAIRRGKRRLRGDRRR